MIEFTHAYKVYPGPVHALKDVNLKISKGEFVYLTGPSGAGKTTLFKLMSAFDKTTSGGVYVHGYDLGQITAEKIPYFRRNIGVIYQDFRLIKNKTVFENIALPLEIRNESEKKIQHRVAEIIDQVGLTHKSDEYPAHLSGGEQQRVAVARALVHCPGVLIADEPTGNLDPYLSKEIIRLLEKVNERGTTVFVATHDHALVNERARRRIEIENGCVIRSGKC
jgi:cell division transport system ATP-binding protein